MHMKNLKGQWGVRARVASWVAMAGLVGSAILPGAALAAALDVTYGNDTTITLGSISFIIVSGSTASSVITDASTLTVDVDTGDTFTIEMTSGNNPANDKGLHCYMSGGKPRLQITGNQTVVITPSASTTTCNYGGGGGGGGGGVTVTTTSCSISAPNGGGTLTGGTATAITWTSAGSGITDCNLYYSVDSGATYGLIVGGTANDGSQSWIVPNTATTKGRVKIECRDAGGGSTGSMIDASDADFTIALSSALPAAPAPVAVVPVAASTALPRATANAALPTAYPVDTLMKSTDPAVSTVYYVGLDAKRHPFPSEAIFKTWFPDFSGVKSISPALLASVALGKPMLSRPGTHWVKIQSDPKTYLVEPSGYTLRWIKDEATALLLGGSDWNKNIIDIEPTYFTKFTVGADLSSADLSASWPAGSLVKGADGKVWYITSTGRREVTSAGQTANKIQARFIETSTAAGWQAKAVESQVVGMEDALFSLQSF